MFALARVWPRRWNEGCADQAEAIGEIWNSFMRSRVLAFISSDQKYVENVLIATFYELVVCILEEYDRKLHTLASTYW